MAKYRRWFSHRILNLFLLDYPRWTRDQGSCFGIPCPRDRWLLCYLPQAILAGCSVGDDIWHIEFEPTSTDDLLYIYAHWCAGMCRTLYPYQRETLERSGYLGGRTCAKFAYGGWHQS